MIPEAAVEAAARLIAAEVWRTPHTGDIAPDNLARLALEAAAPHMLAGAWDEGRVVGMMDPHRIEQSIKLHAPEFAQVANPYRNHPVIPEAAVEA